LRTGGIARDPTDGMPNKLFYDRALAQLHQADFHPGLTAELRSEGDHELPPLSDADWQQLQPWGTLRVEPLVFARGTNRLTEQSEVELNALIDTLHNWPRHYVLVRGNASRAGTDLEANRKLALQRAEAVAKYLQDRGISPVRIRPVAGELQGEASVDFVLGQPRY
jgi:outer membrane protein OmpA-like peptidoglycan-associated protein